MCVDLLFSKQPIARREDGLRNRGGRSSGYQANLSHSTFTAISQCGRGVYACLRLSKDTFYEWREILSRGCWVLLKGRRRRLVYTHRNGSSSSSIVCLSWLLCDMCPCCSVTCVCCLCSMLLYDSVLVVAWHASLVCVPCCSTTVSLL